MSDIDPEILGIVEAAARVADLEIPEDYLPGVAANTALLRQYAQLVTGLALPDHVEPACEYHP